VTLLNAIIHDQSFQLVTLLALIAGLSDWGLAVVRAIRDRVFSVDYVAQYLSSHVLTRFVPIAMLAFIGAALTAVTAGAFEEYPPALSALTASVTLAAWAGLLAYLGETVASIKATSKGGVLNVVEELHVHDAEYDDPPVIQYRYDPPVG